MQIQAINNSNSPSFGMKKFNILSKGVKSENQLTYDKRIELRKSMEKFVREARVKHAKAVQSVNEFFKKILRY